MKRLSFLYSYKIIALVLLLGAMSFEGLAQTSNSTKTKPATVRVTPADKQKQEKTSTDKKEDKKEDTKEVKKSSSISKDAFDSLSNKLTTTQNQLEEATKKVQKLEDAHTKLGTDITDLSKQLRTAQDNIIDPLWLVAAGVLGLLFGFLVGKVLTKPTTQIVEKVTEKIIEKPAAFTAQEKEQWQTQVNSLEKEKNELFKENNHLKSELALVQKDTTATVTPVPVAQVTVDIPPTQENLPATAVLRYANSAINKGEGFEVRDLKEQLRYEYFALDLNEVEGIGTFYVVDNPETQEAAIQNFDSILAVTCEYGELPNGKKKIVLVEAGKLQKDNQFWRIMQKMRIRFE